MYRSRGEGDKPGCMGKGIKTRAAGRIPAVFFCQLSKIDHTPGRALGYRCPKEGR